MAREQSLSGRDAAERSSALARMNAALYAALPPADREMPFSHPEYGALTVDWIIHQSAGHQIHHLKQLEQIDCKPDSGILNPQNRRLLKIDQPAQIASKTPVSRFFRTRSHAKQRPFIAM